MAAGSAADTVHRTDDDAAVLGIRSDNSEPDAHAFRSLHTVTIRKMHGFALLDLIFVTGIIGILCAIAMPRILLAKQAAGTASAIGSMRAITSAQLTYALSCGNGFYAPRLTVLGTPPPLTKEPFISLDLSSANTVTKSGYMVQLSGTAYPSAPPTCNGLAVGEAAQGFKAAADPTEPHNPRFFATNASNVIYEDVATLFAAMPEVGIPVSGKPLQ
jgi:type II secretory pathway pseudopilin PulG